MARLMSAITRASVSATFQSFSSCGGLASRRGPGLQAGAQCGRGAPGGCGEQRQGGKTHGPHQDPGRQQVAFGPGVDDFVGDHHGGGYDGRQQQGGDGTGAVEAAGQVLDAFGDALGAHDAGVLGGMVDMDKAGHGFFPSLRTPAARLPLA